MTNRIRTDTGASKLPGLRAVSTADPELSNWVKSVTEMLQVREGQRGNAGDRAVTQRELKKALGTMQQLVDMTAKAPAEGEIGIELAPGITATVAVEKFAQAIVGSKQFQELARSLDDPNRFDDQAEEVRTELLRSLTADAAKMRAAIQSIERTTDSNERSLSMAVRQLTASLRDAHAGLRETTAAWSDGNKAMATNVLQLQASLGKYYSDGSEGKASLEQEMTVFASLADGLRSSYQVTVQAGGALAGYSLWAQEGPGGKITTAFIINAAQFAIVAPTYSGGVMATPRAEDLVFGVDANGIYLQNNVYIKGNMRIDGTGKLLRDGLRGSLQIAASGQAWSDTTARQAIWLALGNAGSAPGTAHLVIGDMVTIVATTGAASTKHWMGSSWQVPGAVINGSLLVDETVAAKAINTTGLTVKDQNGNIILSSGGMDATWLKNLNASQVGGLGSLATQNAATIGSTVRMPDGTVMGVGDFISRLQKIEEWNISTFMAAAAIGRAYIGNAAVGSAQIDTAAIKRAHIGDAEIDTLKVAGNSITSMGYASVSRNSAVGSNVGGATLMVKGVAGGTGFVVNAPINMNIAPNTTGSGLVQVTAVLSRNGIELKRVMGNYSGTGWSSESEAGYYTVHGTLNMSCFDNPGEGYHTYSVTIGAINGALSFTSDISVIGGYR